MVTPTPSVPTPPRKESGLPGILLVLLGVLVVSVVIIFAGIYLGAHYVARNVNVQVREQGEAKRVEIRTPGGELKIEAGEAAATQRIGLPVYPGAVREKKGASVSIDVGGEEGASVLAQQYETPDPFDKVVQYYRKELGPDFTMERGKGRRPGRLGGILKHDREGVVFESGSEHRHRIVAISRKGNVTGIALVAVMEKEPQ